MHKTKGFTPWTNWFCHLSDLLYVVWRGPVGYHRFIQHFRHVFSTLASIIKVKWPIWESFYILTDSHSKSEIINFKLISYYCLYTNASCLTLGMKVHLISLAVKSVHQPIYIKCNRFGMWTLRFLSRGLRLAASMLVTEVGDGTCWWRFWDGFGRFGHLPINICHHLSVANIML